MANQVNLTFGQAIEILKAGGYVGRQGWNGKVYLWLLPAAKIKSEWVKEPHLKALTDANNGEVGALGSIYILTATGEILTGWQAIETDMLAKDWFEFMPKHLQ